MVLSILKSLVTGDGIDHLRNGNQRLLCHVRSRITIYIKIIQYNKNQVKASKSTCPRYSMYWPNAWLLSYKRANKDVFVVICKILLKEKLTGTKKISKKYQMAYVKVGRYHTHTNVVDCSQPSSFSYFHSIVECADRITRE